jgi:hypothetical protein
MSKAAREPVVSAPQRRQIHTAFLPKADAAFGTLVLETAMDLWFIGLLLLLALLTAGGIALCARIAPAP